MVKVVHVITGLERGGAEMMLRRLIEAHLKCELKYHHRVISLSTVGTHGLALRERGIEVYALGLLSPLGIFRVFPALMHLLWQLRPDVVQTWMVHSDLMGGLAARFVGCSRVVWGIRATDYSVESRRTRALRWLCAHLSRVVPDRIVCAAQASFDDSAAAGYDLSRMMVIPNGFSVPALRQSVGHGAAVRAQVGLSEHDMVVGSPGRYCAAKDHANFIQAAGSLAARYPTTRFLMVGRGMEACNSELMALIKTTRFADRFFLIGERADPFACLDAMDIFVLSSCTEGFPNVLGEAMAMAVPCVTTDVGDASVLLGEAGEVVSPRDAAALAAAVARLLDMPASELQALGRKGQARVEREFSMDAVSRRYANLYEELMTRG